MGRRLDLMILEVLSNINDSMTAEGPQLSPSPPSSYVPGARFSWRSCPKGVRRPLFAPPARITLLPSPGGLPPLLPCLELASKPCVSSLTRGSSPEWHRWWDISGCRCGHTDHLSHPLLSWVAIGKGFMVPGRKAELRTLPPAGGSHTHNFPLGGPYKKARTM